MSKLLELAERGETNDLAEELHMVGVVLRHPPPPVAWQAGCGVSQLVDTATAAKSVVGGFTFEG